MMSLLHLRPFDVTNPASAGGGRIYSSGPAERQELTPAGLVVIRYTVSVFIKVWDVRPGPSTFSTDEVESREHLVSLAAQLLNEYHPEITPFCCVRHRLAGMDALPCAGLNPEFI